MNKFKTAALTSALLMAFGVAHAQSAGGSSTSDGAKGLDNSASPSSNVKSVEETNRTMSGDAMRPQESSGTTSSGASDTSASGSSSSGASSGATGNSTGTTGGAAGLDNSASQGSNLKSVDGANSATQGDALRPDASKADTAGSSSSMTDPKDSATSSGAGSSSDASGMSGSSSSATGTARGLDNSGSAGASPSPDSANSMTKGDAMTPTKPAGK